MGKAAAASLHYSQWYIADSDIQVAEVAPLAMAAA